MLAGQRQERLRRLFRHLVAPELEDETDVAYALAVDSDVHGRYEVQEAAAQTLLALAREHDLLPSVTVLFEDAEM